MSWYENYINNLSQTPSESYKGLTQATINAQWDNTTQLYTIKEESYPFNKEYTEYEAWVDTVSDVSTSTSKVSGNYINILFKDLDHPLNHRGTKYIWEDKTYLCYDMMNKLTLTPNFKAIQCNNQLKWIDKENGSIMTEPCVIGWELMSYQNQVSNDGTIPNAKLILLIQSNENTLKFEKNQRFVISHKTAFKITEINYSNLENSTDDEPTLLQMYIEWTTLLPSDDLVNNLADMSTNIYTLQIDQESVEQTEQYQGQLTATVKLNDSPITIPLKWSTNDSSVVEINNQGSYHLIGEVGSTAQITCCIDENESVCDTIDVKIVEDFLGEKIIQVTPIINELSELDSQEFICGVYINGTKQSDIVECNANWSGDNYTLEETLDGYKLTNNKQSGENLILTFTSDSCEPIVMNIKLSGMF